MFVIEVSIVFCVAVLFSILNRLCVICSLLEDIKKLMTNPNLVIADSMTDNFISKLVKALKKNSKPKTTKNGVANDQ